MAVVANQELAVWTGRAHGTMMLFFTHFTTTSFQSKQPGTLPSLVCTAMAHIWTLGELVNYSSGQDDGYSPSYHTFKNFESCVILFLYLCVCAQVYVCAHAHAPTHFPLPFSLNSSTHLWCDIFSPHQNGKNELQRSNWLERIKKITSLQTWTCQKIILSSAPLCDQPGTLNSPWPLHAAPVSYLLITICFMSPFITSPMRTCGCCTYVLFKAPVGVHFINSQVKDRNSLASAKSLIILNKVNINIYTAFAQEENEEWEFLAICSCSFCYVHYKVYTARRPQG